MSWQIACSPNPQINISLHNIHHITTIPPLIFSESLQRKSPFSTSQRFPLLRILRIPRIHLSHFTPSDRTLINSLSIQQQARFGVSTWSRLHKLNGTFYCFRSGHGIRYCSIQMYACCGGIIVEKNKLARGRAGDYEMTAPTLRLMRGGSWIEFDMIETFPFETGATNPAVIEKKLSFLLGGCCSPSGEGPAG
jgi:hypothetical protein